MYMVNYKKVVIKFNDYLGWATENPSKFDRSIFTDYLKHHGVSYS